MLEKIRYKKQILALIIHTNKNKKKGVNFVTPKKFVLQSGIMNHPKNHNIHPHIHKEYQRKIKSTPEALFITKGKLRVDFYNKKKIYIFSKILRKKFTSKKEKKNETIKSFSHIFIHKRLFTTY